ncbi:lipocalin family protein [Tenacibaculum sp. ZS6-P6]|uniref:lipocalin family protein n=1 Tax=Tenacibaculum sp. ZS6-P6 TaxID=3447503 RepID=UPI003F9E9451
MKKIIILSLTFLCLISCSSNDSEMVDPDNGNGVITDNNGGDNETKDPIIGTWSLFLSTDGVEVDNCLKKTTFIFNEDNSYNQIEFNTVNNNCDEILNVTGEWTSKNNNVYELRRDGYTSGPDVSFEFSDDGKTMIVVRQTYKRQ